MSEFGEHPSAALLRDFPIDERATVPLRRVVRQRAAFTSLFSAALLQPSLDLLLEEACRVATEGCNAPLAKVLEHKAKERQFLIRAGVGWKPGVVGHARATDDPSNPAGESLATQRPVMTRDVRQRQDYHLPRIYPSHHIVSSANVPIIGVSGFYGVLEVDRREEHSFDALDSTFLLSVAGVIADAVERVRRQEALQKAHDARAALLREHHHRVRNSFQAIIARLHRHSQQTTTAESREWLGDIERRVFGMASLYNYLIDAEQTASRMDLGRYLTDLCERIRAFYAVGENGIELTCRCEDRETMFPIDTCMAIGAVVNELVANAVEHAFPAKGGRIEVGLQRRATGTTVSISDNGTGFRQTPSESIGLSVARQLVSGIGGSILRASPESGTVWTIILPAGGGDS